MQALVAIGIVLVTASLAALGYCVWQAWGIRTGRSRSGDAEQRFRRLAAINLAALGLAGLGLAFVTAGLLL